VLGFPHVQLRHRFAVCVGHRGTARRCSRSQLTVTPFRNRGGKLIVYHGFSDPDISPINSINYFDDVVRNFTGTPSAIPIAMLRAKTQMFFRLFMVLGMQHCSGGAGADQFDALTALEQWVEQGQAPDGITASKVMNGAVQFTRPLCPYPQLPQLPQYSGTGNVNDAANWTCAVSQ
jgi:feruloyl esterase